MSQSCFMSFEKLGEDGKARRGRLSFPRGNVETPAFMPVATQASVKGLSPEEVTALGAGIVLCNAYHLFLRPGHELIRGLAEAAKEKGAADTLADAAHLLLDQARILEGEPLPDPPGHAKRMAAVMAKGFGS